MVSCRESERSGNAVLKDVRVGSLHLLITIEWLHLRHNYPKDPYARTFWRYIFLNKPLLHTTRIISPIILSPFTMSKVTKASIKCATAAQKYREGLEPSAKAWYLETNGINRWWRSVWTCNTFNRWETSSSHHIPWYRELSALYTKSIHCWWSEELQRTTGL